MAPLLIGVLFDKVQMTDITGVDLINQCSKAMAKDMVTLGLPDLSDLAVEMEIIWIARSVEGSTWMTPNVRVIPTHSYGNAPVDELDVLLVGGPLLSNMDPESLEFIRRAKKAMDRKAPKAKILSTCVGSLWLAMAGVLDGRKATVNRMAIEMAKEKFEKVEWQDQRWVQDEMEGQVTFWTSGAAGCGIDMIAKFIEMEFQEPIVKAAWSALGFDPNIQGQYYSRSS